MKIGFFTDTYFPQVNGVTYTLTAWREKLEDMGHEVSIYYPGGDYKPAKGEHPFPSFDFRLYQGYRIAIPFFAAKKARGLDIIHQHGLYTTAMAGVWASWRNKTPRILTFHTPGDEYLSYMPLSNSLGGVYKKSYLAWERWLLNHHAKVTTASPVIKERLASNGINDVEVLSNGVDLGLFYEDAGMEFRRRHGVKSKKVIGFCGRLGYEKHVEDLINAADGFDGEVLIAGDGPARQYYESLSAGKKNVKMLGFISREELRGFYSALDVFVFPSFCETQGLVALESMACGTPVVAVPVAALKTTVEDGVTGYHYMPKDTEGLLEQVSMCMKNMKRLEKACKKEALDNSVEKSAERLDKIYMSLV